MSVKLDFSYCELKRIAKRIVLFLLTLALVVFWGMSSPDQPSLSPSTTRFSLGQPSSRIFSVGDIEFAPIHLDGFSLFQEHNPQINQKKLVSRSAIA